MDVYKTLLFLAHSYSWEASLHPYCWNEIIGNVLVLCFVCLPLIIFKRDYMCHFIHTPVVCWMKQSPVQLLYSIRAESEILKCCLY